MNPVVYRKQMTYQGFGLGFLLAAILFVFTAKLESFLVVPLGLLLGFGLGSWLDRRAPAQPVERHAVDDGSTILNRTLFHPRLLVRLPAALALGAILLAAAWYAGYYLLPEGVLLGPGVTASASSEPVSPAWLAVEILARNSAWVVVIILLNLLLVPSGFGYLIPLAWCIYYGLLLGTNSFAYAMPERMAPSLLVFQRAGPIEISAYLLSAAAAYMPDPIPQMWKKVNQAPRRVWLALGISLLLLLFAALREAGMIAGL